MSETPRKPATPAGRSLAVLGQPDPVNSPLFTWRRAAVAASLVAVFGIGAAGTHAAQIAWTHFGHRRAVVQADATAQSLHRLEDEVTRLKSSVDTLRMAADSTRQDDALRALKHNIETIKSDLQQARQADGSSLQQIAAKLDKPDQSAKLAEIMTRLDRIEQTAAAKPVAAADGAQARIAELTNRLDRIEHQVAAPAITGSIPQPAHAAETTTVGRTVPPVPPKAEAMAAARPVPPRPTKLEAWVLRDVYDGMALVQGRGGGLREVGPGEYLPGAGQIRSIERRGRTWVVMTSQGEIGADTF